mgnify:CR=1 FL=1
MKKLKLFVIIMSCLFLVEYLNYNKLENSLNHTVMDTKVLSPEEIELRLETKEKTFIWPEITINGGRVPYDLDLNMLLIPQSMAESEMTGTLSVPDGELFFAADEALEDKQSALSENKRFSLYWVRDNICFEYNVYFTGMPVMWMITESVDELEVSHGTVEIYDPYHSNLQVQKSACNWHRRGATTLQYEKSSYRLTLTEQKLSLLGMRKDDDWMMHALYDDDGLIHNKLSYEVWQKIASTNNVPNDEGISMEYVEVFKDGYYQGVYGISERIDEKELGLNEKDILYKCKWDREPTEDDFYSELTEEMTPSFEWKYPDNFQMENWEPLRKWTDFYCMGELNDYESGKDLLNMQNAIDYNIFNLLICGMDNTMKNIYFWADYQGDGTYCFIKIPWDLNMTWGNSWIDDITYKFNKYQEKTLNNQWGWTNDMDTLYQANPGEIGELLKVRWQELRRDVLTKEVLYSLADAEFSYLHGSGAYARNYQKWPAETDYWLDNYIYEYIDKKIDYLDEYFGQMGEP